MIRVFIGYDPREAVAFNVLSHSIFRHSSRPVAITGLKLSQLDMWRARDPKQSTAFAFSRFLVPYLCGYEGRAIFMDCDMLCRSDIAELWEARGEEAALVVKHDYTPSTATKFLNQPQTVYPCKNWSSVVVFNNAKCRALTPAYVNTATGLELHQFKWAESVGEIPTEWNHLVGEYAPSSGAKLVHYTLGGPYFNEYSGCEFSEEWFRERDYMLECEQRTVHREVA